MIFPDQPDRATEHVTYRKLMLKSQGINSQIIINAISSSTINEINYYDQLAYKESPQNRKRNNHLSDVSTMSTNITFIDYYQKLIWNMTTRYNYVNLMSQDALT